MTTQERIRLGSILEKMRKNKEAAERLGLKDVSTFKRIPRKPNNVRIYSEK